MTQVNTPYEMGQQVWHIGQQIRTDWLPCGFCGGTGECFGADGTRSSCPKCYRRGGFRKNHREEWALVGSLTIGQIRFEWTGHYEHDSHYTNYGSQQEVFYWSFMAYETGIGTGRVYHEDSLFPTEAEALAKCAELNTAAEPA